MDNEDREHRIFVRMTACSTHEPDDIEEYEFTSYKEASAFYDSLAKPTDFRTPYDRVELLTIHKWK